MTFMSYKRQKWTIQAHLDTVIDGLCSIRADMAHPTFCADFFLRRRLHRRNDDIQHTIRDNRAWPAPLTGKGPLEAHAHSGTGAEESMGAVILNDKDNVTGVSCVETLQQRDVDSGNGSVRHCP